MESIMDANIRYAHSLIDSFREFVNSHRVGYCKHWKAASLLVQVFEYPDQFTGCDLQRFVCNCLEMEGFRTEDCLAIAAWIQERVDSFVDNQAKVAYIQA
jgi:hypothetical protein